MMGWYGLDCPGSGKGTMEDSCDNDNEPFGCIGGKNDFE
jgi:hypothetical protein